MSRLRRFSDPGMKESGVAIVEFALVLPLLILISLCVLELVHMTAVKKIATHLSREAANLAFRGCNGEAIVLSGQPDNMPACLEREKKSLQDFAGTVVPNTVVVLSYYDFTKTPVRRVVSTTGAYSTRFSSGATGGVTAEVQALPQQGVYVGEVYVPYQPIIGSFLTLFRNNVTFLYDSTTA